jgi:FlaA1/EpsC-like NDP-sugar epimerase
LRPGEKLYEELLLAGEGVNTTTHEKICVAKAEEYDRDVLNRQLEKLFVAAKAMELQKVVELLQQIVPEFTPTFQGHKKMRPPINTSRGKIVPLIKNTEDG